MFAVSDKHTGPWHNEAEKPDQALAKGRAMWGEDKKLYVAKISPLNPAESLPSIQTIVGELREVLVDKHGSGADSVFDDRKVMASLETYWEHNFRGAFVKCIEGYAELDFNVASQVKIYSPDNVVKPNDFK